jgi:hypothetical protein
MHNTNQLLRFAASACFVAGGLLVVLSGWRFSFADTMAQLTGPGAQVVVQSDIDAPEPEAMLMQGHAAAPVSTDVTPQLLVGILLLLLGLGIYVLYVIRTSRNVPVHGVHTFAEGEGVRIFTDISQK